MKLKKAIEKKLIDAVYMPISETRAIKIDYTEWDKYLECEGEIKIYEDYDGEDDEGKPIRRFSRDFYIVKDNTK